MTATTKNPPEVLFYHLEHFPLERVLPALLEKTLERGWRAVVQAGSNQQVEALDALLWTYRDDSFLPHAAVPPAAVRDTAKQDDAAGRGNTDHDHDYDCDHPVILTVADDNHNDANVRFLVDGATTSKFEGYDRMVFMFDGHDSSALSEARQHWKAAKATGCSVTYWQQSSNGRWEKKA